ncbi:hypothetical protein JOS77_13250 [Chromobacterium haemolyticum]|nr:hypothetical protein JOS77_13250 [Chromobacterium haemolyticum]
MRHRVAIECKDWNRPIDQGRVLEFHQKIKNIGNDLVGVIIAKKGYQGGAENVAKRHGILILTEESIPSLPQLLASSITTLLIHEPALVGEPFWCIAELGDKSNGQSTGTYYAFPKEFPFNIPLFISKRHAEIYLKKLPDAQRFSVFGLPQYKLRSLIGFAYMSKLTFAIAYEHQEKTESIFAFPIALNAEMLKNDYLLLDFPKNLEKTSKVISIFNKATEIDISDWGRYFRPCHNTKWKWWRFLNWFK